METFIAFMNDKLKMLMPDNAMYELSDLIAEVVKDPPLNKFTAFSETRIPFQKLERLSIRFGKTFKYLCALSIVTYKLIHNVEFQRYIKMKYTAKLIKYLYRLGKVCVALPQITNMKITPWHFFGIRKEFIVFFELREQATFDTFWFGEKNDKRDEQNKSPTKPPKIDDWMQKVIDDPFRVYKPRVNNGNYLRYIYHQPPRVYLPSVNMTNPVPLLLREQYMDLIKQRNRPTNAANPLQLETAEIEALVREYNPNILGDELPRRLRLGNDDNGNIANHLRSRWRRWLEAHLNELEDVYNTPDFQRHPVPLDVLEDIGNLGYELPANPTWEDIRNMNIGYNPPAIGRHRNPLRMLDGIRHNNPVPLGMIELIPGNPVPLRMGEDIPVMNMRYNDNLIRYMWSLMVPAVNNPDMDDVADTLNNMFRE